MKNRELYFEAWSECKADLRDCAGCGVSLLLCCQHRLPKLFPLQLKELMIASPVFASLPQTET